jgi:hypothetical protein
MNGNRDRVSNLNWGWGWKAATLALVLGTGFGCGPSTLWHLWKGDQAKNAEYPLTAPEGKREVTIAVSVMSQHGVPSGVDLDLASKIGSQMKTLSEANKGTPVRIVEQTKVNSFVTNNRDRWTLGNPGEFAKQIGADYWIDVSLLTYNLMDKEFGSEICRGSATLDVSVYEAGNQTPKHHYPLVSKAVVRPNDVAQKNIYQNDYLGQLATEVAFMHVNYKADQKRALMK